VNEAFNTSYAPEREKKEKVRIRDTLVHTPLLSPERAHSSPNLAFSWHGRFCEGKKLPHFLPLGRALPPVS
jgi:hypothetical protein